MCSPTLRQKLLRFNGGPFESAEALPVTDEELELLIEASRADWHDVELAIFGTLAEQALDPGERHRLGAHYTPRAYVENLVLPTVIEPLREEWAAAQAAAVTLAKAGKLDEAVGEVKRFHQHLCAVRVLDPAGGTGNFLYVTLEHMKRLEGEVLTALEDFGEQQHELIEDATDEQKRRIRELGESLDAHRRRQQAQHPRLTVTEMYNVLAALHAGQTLSERERAIHEQGLVSVLRNLHDDLDTAVCEAYGWRHDISDEEILSRLVALNHVRAEEERGGLVRWLRPAYQHPQGTVQASLDMQDEGAKNAVAGSKAKSIFPSNLAEQARAVRSALSAHSGVVTPAQLAKSFQRARVDRIAELLQTLVLLGQARQVEEGKYDA